MFFDIIFFFFFFYLATFSVLYLWFFIIVTMMCLGVFLFGSLLSGTSRTLECRCVFSPNSEKFCEGCFPKILGSQWLLCISSWIHFNVLLSDVYLFWELFPFLLLSVWFLHLELIDSVLSSYNSPGEGHPERFLFRLLRFSVLIFFFEVFSFLLSYVVFYYWSVSLFLRF